MRKVAVLAFALLVAWAGNAPGDEPSEKDVEQVYRKLIADLNSPDPQTVGKTGYVTRQASPALVKRLGAALTDSDEVVRKTAARALGDIGPPAQEAIPALTLALKDKELDVRMAAIDALAQIGRGYLEVMVNKDIVPALLQALQDDEALVRFRAAVSFGVIGSKARLAVPTLIEVVKGGSIDKKEAMQVRMGAVGSLALIGPDAEAAIPALLEVLKSGEYQEFECMATSALGRIGRKEEQVVPALIETLTDKRRLYLRRNAGMALAWFGPKAKAAVPALIEAMDVSDIDDSRQAKDTLQHVLLALAKIGRDAEAAVPALRKLAEDPGAERDIREAAARALKEIRP